MGLTLVINAGSSSQKCALFEKESRSPLWRGSFDFHESEVKIYRKEELVLSKKKNFHSTQEALECLLQAVHEPIALVGHRIVHGGEKLIRPTLLTIKVKKELELLSSLAPLHNKAALEGLNCAEKLFPQALQYGVFDTAFHATLSEVAATYPLPYSWKKEGVRRYGFHGISHEYCSKEAALFLKKPIEQLKMVVCHLGAGSSLCAVKGGKSVDTTMGFTPLEGLMMGTRSGSIDPGLLFYLLKNKKMEEEELEKILYSKSGLLGISGISEDMREIEEEASEGNLRASLAVEMFLHRLKSFLGAMIAVLEGVDVIVFTAGIGENSSLVRKKVCASLAYLGVEIDPKKNEVKSNDDREISTSHSKIRVLVIPTKEEWEIAHQGSRVDFK